MRARVSSNVLRLMLKVRQTAALVAPASKAEPLVTNASRWVSGSRWYTSQGLRGADVGGQGDKSVAKVRRRCRTSPGGVRKQSVAYRLIPRSVAAGVDKPRSPSAMLF